MTICLLVAGVLQCATLSGPQPTPAQAAAILAPHQYVAPTPSTGPTVTILASSSTAGPFGDFKPYEPPRSLNPAYRAYEPIVTYVGPWRGVQRK